jgi:uncharacterized RDD family membrane protein YckC
MVDSLAQKNASMKKCPHCGKEYPDEATVCVVDETSLDPTQLENPLIRDKSPYAGFWIRVLARLIDMAFVAFVGYAVGVLAIVIIISLAAAGIIPPGWQGRMREFSLAPFGFGMLGVITYHFFCEGFHGATMGKYCCGIRVISKDGTPSTLKGALIRSLAYYIDSFFLGLVACISMDKSPLNQRYGDVWGKTAVVHIKQLTSEPPQPRVPFIAALLAGTGCMASILVVGVIYQAF